MACCGGEEEKDPRSPIEQERQCTDVLFFIAFIAFWVGMFYVFGQALTLGVPERLYYGVGYHFDEQGMPEAHTCGLGDFATDYYQYFPKPVELQSNDSYIPSTKNAESFCLSECPDAIDSDVSACYVQWASAYAAASAYDLMSVDMSNTWLNAEGDGADDIRAVLKGSVCRPWVKYDDSKHPILTHAQLISSLDLGISEIPEGPCFPVCLASADVFYRCVPGLGGFESESNCTSNSSGVAVANNATNASCEAAAGALDSALAGAQALTDLLSADEDSTSAKAIRAFGEMYLTWPAILGIGVGCGLLLGFVQLLVLNYIVDLVVWGVILLCNVLLILLSVYTLTQGCVVDYEGYTPANCAVLLEGGSFDYNKIVGSDQETWFYLACVVCLVTLVMLLATIIMIPRIRIAIAIMKVASSAVRIMPTLILVPLPLLVIIIALMVYWMVGAGYLWSAGTIEVEGSGIGYTDNAVVWVYDETLQYMFGYHLFGLLWTVQVVIGVYLTTIAGAIAEYYWRGGEDLPMAPVLESYKRATWWHFGSICLGAFIVAVIQFIRIIIEYIDSQTKDLQEGNPMLKYLIMIAKCCAAYLERILQYINMNAYIIVAVEGTNYCASAIKAISLLLNNMLRVIAVSGVSAFVLTLSILMIVAAAGFIAYQVFSPGAGVYPDLSSYGILLSVLFTCIFAFFTAKQFLGLYEMAIQTVLLSFCSDCEQNGEPRFAPKPLQDAFGMVDADRERIAAERQAYDEKHAEASAQ